MDQNSDLMGKVALVTGGGSGIGDAVARRFVAAGAQVGIVGRRASLLEATARETGALALPGDVSDSTSVKGVVARLVDECGGIDILVNNAGIGTMGSVEEVDDEDWSKVVEVNLNGALRLSREVIPHLRARGGGAIVNVSSIGGVFAAPKAVAYGTTKSALLGLTRALARDYGREGIRVNTLCPGWVDTPMIEPLLHMLADLHGCSVDDARSLLVANNPINRMAEPDEIARSVEFLATEASSYITGAVLMADGGQSIVDVGSLAMSGPASA